MRSSYRGTGVTDVPSNGMGMRSAQKDRQSKHADKGVYGDIFGNIGRQANHEGPRVSRPAFRKESSKYIDN